MHSAALSLCPRSDPRRGLPRRRETLSLDAWGLVIANLLVMACIMAVIEGGDVGDGPDKILNKLGAREGQEQKRFANVANSVYYGFLGLTGGAPAHEAERLPGALVVMGFALFCMLFAASYTGSTAAVLIADSGRRASITGKLPLLSLASGLHSSRDASDIVADRADGRRVDAGRKDLPHDVVEEALHAAVPTGAPPPPFSRPPWPTTPGDGTAARR